MTPAGASALRAPGVADIPIEGSLSSSLEHLVSASQGVLSKRVDLALLEVHETFSRSLEDLALTGVCILLTVGSWFALAAALVVTLLPGPGHLPRLFLFGIVNGAGALACSLLLARRGRPVPTEGRRSPRPQDTPAAEESR